MNGSLMNRLYEGMIIDAPEPKAGMGATVTHYTDRDAATVVAWDGKIVTVQYDHAERVDSNGMSDAQQYKYTPNPEGTKLYFRRDKHGRWVNVIRSRTTGRWISSRSCGLALGIRDAHFDYSF